MAKHCTNCGHEVQDSDKFCAGCGTKVGGALVPAQPIQYEVCEIIYQVVKNGGWFGQDQSQLCAKALGPKGIYFAEVSALLKDNYPWGKFS